VWVSPKPDPASLGVRPAGELVGSGAAIRIIVGADHEQVIVSSALTVAVAVGAEVQLLDDMEHALAEEPGIQPAPQGGAAPQQCVDVVVDVYRSTLARPDEPRMPLIVEGCPILSPDQAQMVTIHSACSRGGLQSRSDEC